LPSKPQRIFIVFAVHASEKLDSAVVQINGIKVFCWFALRPIDFCLFKARSYCRDHAGRDLILKFKDVIQRSVKSISPQMDSGIGVDELAGDTDLAPRLSDAAFQHVADT